MSDLTPHPDVLPDDRQAMRRVVAHNSTAQLLKAMASILQHLVDGVEVSPYRIQRALDTYQRTQQVDELLEDSAL